MKKWLLAMILAPVAALAQTNDPCAGGFLYEGTLGDGQVHASTVTIGWDAPTENCDGTPLADGAQFYVYHGTSTNDLQRVATNAWDDTQFSYTAEHGSGTHYFGFSAVDTSGNESSVVVYSIAWPGRMPPPFNIRIEPTQQGVAVTMENLPTDVASLGLEVSSDMATWLQGVDVAMFRGVSRE